MHSAAGRNAARWRSTPLRSGLPAAVVLLAAVLLPGCADKPLGITSLPTISDSTRYVSVPGTPHAIATVWQHGVVNLCAPVHALAESRAAPFYHLVKTTLVWRGTRLGSNVTGVLCTTSPLDPEVTVSAGSLALAFHGDTLAGLAHTILSTPCGPVGVDVPVTLVPVSSEVP